jgi:hypothetical protein
MRHFLPLALHLVSLLFTIRCSKTASAAASLAILGRGLAMRCSLMAAGNASARWPEISLRFTRRTPVGHAGEAGISRPRQTLLRGEMSFDYAAPSRSGRQRRHQHR